LPLHRIIQFQDRIKRKRTQHMEFGSSTTQLVDTIQ
jgi:hypothetical protein